MISLYHQEVNADEDTNLHAFDSGVDDHQGMVIFDDANISDSGSVNDNGNPLDLSSTGTDIQQAHDTEDNNDSIHEDEDASANPADPNVIATGSGTVDSSTSETSGSPTDSTDDDPTDDNTDDDHTVLIRAFRETAPVRFIYLQTAIANVFGNTTVAASETMLKAMLAVLRMTQSFPKSPPPAQTLATVKRRLALNLDDYITCYPVCPLCFKVYYADRFSSLTSPNCLEPSCKGQIYQETVSRTDPGNATVKRIPIKTQPYACLIKGLQRMLLRPDFVASLVEGRRTDLPLSEYAIMQDIMDGELYQNLEVGLKRVINDDGTVCDVEVSPGSRKRLWQCELGLSLTLNVDW